VQFKKENCKLEYGANQKHRSNNAARTIAANRYSTLERKVMRTYFTLFLSIFFFFVLSSCNTQKNKEESYENFPIEVTDEYKKVESWTRFDFPEFGPLYDYYLKRPKVIQGIPCKGRFTLDKDGKLYVFTISEDYVLNGTLLPKGSRYEASVGFNYTRDGYMITPSKNLEVHGYLARHKGTLLENYHIDFYNEGQLRGFKPVNYVEIDGILCKGGKKDSRIRLYPDGSLFTCYLAEDTVIERNKFQEGTQVIFNENGEVFQYSRELYIKILRGLKI
jgi:hypothetical protein